MKIDNLYKHADGGYYCVLSEDASIKAASANDGEWMDGIIYTGIDGKMRATSNMRWVARFKKVAEYTENDEAVLSMIRRCNPGDSELDFLRVFESWHESEMGITGHMLELAVGAAMERLSGIDVNKPAVEMSLTITTADLQRIVQTYEIERVPEAHGFTFVMRKSFPDQT